MNTNNKYNQQPCLHCGDVCSVPVILDEKVFCCDGCRQVYLLLNENGLCRYYDISNNPGIKATGKFTDGRFAYLDDEGIIGTMLQFKSPNQCHVTFSLPQIHCSSCIFLLENLHRINAGVIKSQSNFQRKELFVVYNPELISLRKLVELLAFIGYEPSISLENNTPYKNRSFNRKKIFRIGVAGFCFANIMMLSFPEYFSGGTLGVAGLKLVFNWLILALSIPVLFFSASVFFISAYKGLRQRQLNIDAPIALAILVTFTRSYYEIISNTGSGYLDSGTGIVFFMLIGRWFQDKTYDAFSFDRDYRSYFPLGVNVVIDGEEKNIPVTQLKNGNTIITKNEEMIPADAILLKGNARIDYSFVTGETMPIAVQPGQVVYAGGKQTGTAIELQTIHEPSQSYITGLWNNDVFSNGKNKIRSFIHPWSRYFTTCLFIIAALTVLYWWFINLLKLLPALTAVLIVACPCSLLLSATFSFGNMLRVFGRNKLYLKNAAVIETLAGIDTIVFDKTGTITLLQQATVEYVGTPLTNAELAAIKEMSGNSSHPLSRIIHTYIKEPPTTAHPYTTDFKEHTGLGVEAKMQDTSIQMGSADFINITDIKGKDYGSRVHVMINKVHMGYFNFSNQYRPGLIELVTELQKKSYRLEVLSGDNDAEVQKLHKIFGKSTPVQFHQSPQQKLDHIQQLQQQNQKVLMLGDGLNDAGALMQSNVGIAVSDNTSRFTPACDAILDGEKLHLLGKFILYARQGKKIITAGFILSLLYNVVGVSFAVQGLLAPVIAAILMPVSSISIVLLTILLSSVAARRLGL